MVTGASRGVARGIASADLPCGIHKITCDHLDDTQTAAAFESLANGLDILVNSAE
jgi:hypothetical protein